MPRRVFSLAQPFHGWGIGQIELQARFIGLPMMLKLKRGTKPDESGSDALVAALPAVNGWAREKRRPSLSKSVQLILCSDVDVLIDQRRCRQDRTVKPVRRQYLELGTGIQDNNNTLFGRNVYPAVGCYW